MKCDAGDVVVGVLAAIGALVVSAYVLGVVPLNDDLGAGRTADVTPQEVVTASTAASVAPSGPADEESPRLAASALSSQEPSQSLQEAAAPPGGLVSGGALASLLSDLEEPWRPTPEGLLLRTSDLWAQEDFLTLRADRLREFLPLDDTLATIPEGMDLRDLIGTGLPTIDDCRIGLRDEHTQRLLENLLVTEAMFSELCEIPIGQRSKPVLAAIRALKTQRDAAEERLMERLDMTTTYRHWRLLSRLYQEWTR